jgi:hypothetical protein
MKSYAAISFLGTSAVKRMRQQKLHNGQPFMINMRDLPQDQCFMEYPDGSMLQVSLIGNAREFKTIRKLTVVEAGELRRRLQLG